MDRDKCKKRKIDGHKCEEKKKEPIKQEAEIEEKKIKAIFEEESDARVKPEEVERLRKRVETVKTENIIQRESYEVEKHKKDKTESEEDRAEVKEIIMKKRKNPHEAQKDEMHCSKKETGNVVESEEHELNKLTQVSKKREERNKEIFQEKNVGTKGEKNIEKKLKTYRGKIEEDESDDELLCLVKMKQCSKDIKNKLTKSVGPKSVIIKSENSNDHFERKNNALLNLNQSVEVVKILNKYSKDSTTLSIKEKKFTQKNLQTLKKVKVVLKRLNLGNYRVSGNLFKSYSIKKVAPTEVKHKNRINLMNLPKLMNKHDVDKKPKDLPNLKCKVQSSTENALKTSKNPKIRYIPKPKSKCLESNIGDANKVKEDEFKCAMIKEIKMEVDLDIKSILKKTCKVTLTKLENDGNINLRTFFKALEKKKGMSKNNNNKIVETVDSSSKSSNTNKFSLVTSSKTSNDDVENEISLESKISDFISSSLSKKMENNSRQIDKSSKIVKSSDKNSSSTTKPKNVDKLIIKNVELSKSFKGKTNSVLSSKKTEKDTRLIVDKSSKLSKHSIPKNCSPTSLSKLDEKIVEKSSEFLKMPNKNRSLLGKETKNDDRLISKNLVPFKSFDVKNDIPSTRRIKNDSKQIDKSLKSIKVSEVKNEKTLSKNKEDELIENNSMLARSFNVSKGSTSSSSDTNIFETRVGKSSESVEDLILKDSSSTKSISSLIKSNKSKFIPGASYIIVNKNESKDKTLSFTYDCVLCSPNKIILMNGTIMKSHLRTKGHLLNVLEVDDYEMYESYKDKMTLDVSELFKEVCHRQNFETIFRNKILTSKNKRQDLIDHILKMRNIKKKDVSKTTMKIQSENCDLLVKHKKFSLIEPPNISGSIIPDFQLFTETLVYKHKGRNPIQIVFALDNTESYIKTEEHAEKIKVIRGKRLNFDNLLDSFKSRDALGKKSLIIILCGIYSVIKAIPLAICKKKKCSNPPSQYSVFPDVSSDYLISKALRIHEYILDHTTNDQVMFCELIPIDLSKEKDDRCNNGHIVRNFLPRNERERYLSIVKDYNSFVLNHTRMIGFKSWNLLNSLYPSRFKQKDGYTSKANTDKEIECSCLLSKILKCKESVKPTDCRTKKQLSSYSERVKCTSPETPEMSHFEIPDFQSFTENLVLKHKTRHPKKIVFTLDSTVSYFRTTDYVEEIKIVRVKNLNFINLISSLKSNNSVGKDSLIIILCGIFSVVKDTPLSICKKMRCPKPLTKYSILPNVSSDYLISSALRIHEYILDHTTNDQVMFCELEPIDLSKDKDIRCAHGHVVRNFLPHKEHERYLSIINEYNSFVANHTRMIGFESWNLLNSLFPSRFKQKHSHASVVNKDKLVENSCLLSKILKNKKEFVNQMHNHPKEQAANSSSDKEICSSASIKTTSHIGGRFSQETEDFNELKRKKLADGLNASRSSEVLEKLPEVPKIASHSERKKFTKVIIIANHYYAHYVDRFRAPQVEVLTVEISSLNCVLSTIKENCKLQPSCTLWLLPTGIFRIAQTECCHFCWNTYSPCPDPVNVLIPDETVVNEDEDFVENINKSYLDIIMMINSIIGSESSFMVLPAIPPSFMEIEKYYHYEYHKISEINKKKVCYYHMATHDNIERFNKYIIRLDKELTKLAILQCRKINISEYYFECYDEILSQVNYHVQVFYFEDYKRAPIVYKYIEWFECVSKFINYCALQINTPILDIRQETRDLWVSDFNRSVLHNSKQITFDGHHSKENTSAELFKENYNDERINIEISNDRHNYMEIPFDGHYSKENTTDELFFQENFTDELINNKISNDRRNSMEIPFDRHYSKENTTDRPFPNENDTSGLIGKEYTTSERIHGNDSLDKEAISEKFHSDFKAQHEAYLNSVSPPAERKTVKEYTTTSLVLSNTDFLRINDTLFDNAYIIHNEYLSLSSMNQNWKNMNYIYHEMSAKPENDIASIVSKLGDIRPNSVCFLAFNLLVFTKTSVSPECIKFSCPVSLPIININMKRNNEIGFVSVVAMNKMMEIISFATKLSIHVPVVILPLYPTKIYCDDGTYEGHKLIHNALESDTRIVSGERKNWTTFSRVVANLWTSFMKTNYEKYFASEKLESYIKHQYKFLSFQEHYEKSLPCGDVARWDDIFQAFLHILVSDIDRRKGVTSSTGISKFTTDHNLKTVDVVIWNVFESNEGMIFDYFKEMDPKSVVRQCEDHFRIEVPRRNKDKIPETLIKCKARNDEQISCALDDEDASQTFFGKDWKDLVTFGSENSLKFIIRAAKALASQVTKPKEKVFFISPSLKFLKMIKSVVLYVVKETNVRLVLLGEASVDSECFDVFLGVPSTIIDFHWNMLNLLNIQTLIIDDVTKILSNSGDKALLLTIFRRMNIKNNPNLKKMFVADSYDSETTNHLSALFGLPLIEVKEPDTARKWGQVSSKRNEISRLHKPESTPKCYYRKNEQNRRSSFYGSTESRGVPTSKSRKSRSNSRDKRPRSRSRSKSSSKYRERICHSRSRSKSPKRSVTHVRSQKRWKRDDLPTVDRIENTDAEANYEDSPDQLMETLGVSLYKDFVAEKVKLRGIHKGEFDVYFDSPDMHYNYEKFYEEFCIDYNKKYGRNRTDQHKESQWKNYWEKMVESVNKEDWKLKMNELINNYKLKAKDLSSNSKEYITNINSRNSYSNLIEGETSKRNHAPQHSSRTHSRSLSKFDNLQCSQVPLSLYNVGDSRNLEGSSLDFSTKESSSSYISPQSFQSAMVPSSSTSNYKFSSSSMHYSSHSVENINEAINLLEKVSSKLGMLGLAISAICHSVKQSLNDRNKILILLREEENITILKMAINKLEKLQINAPPSEIPFLSNVVDQTRHLIECAQNTPL